MTQRPKITFLTHFEELRKRILIFIGFLFLAWIILFTQFHRLVPFLMWPYQQAFPGHKLTLVFTTLPEAIMAALKSTFFLAFAVSIPVLVYQTWRFLSPALFPHEKKFFAKAFFLVALFCLGSIALAYFLVFPALLKVLLGLGYSHFVSYLRVQSYLAFLGKGLLFAAIVSQIPLITALLVKIEILPNYGGKRRLLYLVGIAYGCALFLSPGDIVGQLILATCFYILFESGYLLAKVL
ncbi:twin-arginine translocase subunit TatC [Thermodesulfatator atlanticus]